MFSSAQVVNTCAVFLISLHMYQTTVMNKDNTIVTANMFPFMVWNCFLWVCRKLENPLAKIRKFFSSAVCVVTVAGKWLQWFGKCCMWRFLFYTFEVKVKHLYGCSGIRTSLFVFKWIWVGWCQDCIFAYIILHPSTLTLQTTLIGPQILN